MKDQFEMRHNDRLTWVPLTWDELREDISKRIPFSAMTADLLAQVGRGEEVKTFTASYRRRKEGHGV
jgi:hypothetical protein